MRKFLLFLFFFNGCISTKKDFYQTNEIEIKDWCKHVVLHLKNRRERSIKFKQCVFFRTEGLYEKYKKKNEEMWGGVEESLRQATEQMEKREHELRLKRTPTNINLDHNIRYRNETPWFYRSF